MRRLQEKFKARPIIIDIDDSYYDADMDQYYIDITEHPEWQHSVLNFSAYHATHKTASLNINLFDYSRGSDYEPEHGQGGIALWYQHDGSSGQAPYSTNNGDYAWFDWDTMNDVPTQFFIYMNDGIAIGTSYYEY